MRPLYLIRHASPVIQPDVPAERWTLSPRGVEEARALAEVARGWGLRALYTSNEPKAQSTALIVGDGTGLPAQVVEGVHELKMDGWIGNADAFGETVREVLEQPELAAPGCERAADAAERFARAVELVAGGELPAAVVSHGRVLTAYLASRAPMEDPFELWRSIPMPGWGCIDLDARRAGLMAPFSGLE
jgi:broad specificity phosphatase PhoE